MVHTGIYATSAECIAAAGNNYASTAVDEAMINGFCLQAEGIINTIGKHTFATVSAEFTALPAGGKYILTAAECAFVGKKMLNYNPKGEDGYLNRTEYEDRVNVLRDIWMMLIGVIKSENFKSFVVDGA